MSARFRLGPSRGGGGGGTNAPGHYDPHIQSEQAKLGDSLGVDFPFFSTIVLSKNRPFSLEVFKKEGSLERMGNVPLEI